MGKAQNGGEETWTEFRKRVKLSFRAKIITGIVVLVPAVVTFLVLEMVFRWVDGLAQPLIKLVFQTRNDIPALGIVLTLAVIWVAGMLAGNVFGRRLIGQGDTLIARIPIIGSIYSPVKQFVETIVHRNKNGFRQVVLAEYPSEGLWILGFATSEVKLDDSGTVGRCVFVPTSPNPATGWMVIFPRHKVRDTNLTVEEAMRLIVSGGIVVPEGLKSASAYRFPENTATAFPGLETHRESEHVKPSADVLPPKSP